MFEPLRFYCNMEWVIHTREICHRDTCLNLLGWAYKAQGNFDKAVECCKMSLEIKPGHNALKFLLHNLNRFEKERPSRALNTHVCIECLLSHDY